MIEQVFFNEVKARFSLREPKVDRPTNIYLVCRINKKQVKLATGVKVYPEHWNKEKQEAYVSCRLTELDNINNVVTNEKLAELRVAFNEFKRYICGNPKDLDDSLDILKKYVYKEDYMNAHEHENAIHWLRNTLIADRTIKDSTRSDYVKQIKFFEEFLQETSRYPISFDDINLPLIKDYETYLFNKPVGKGNTTKTTTVGNKVEKIIVILRRAEQQGKIDIHGVGIDKYKKPQSRQGNDNDIYLTEDEIAKIYALELTGREEQVRDLFVLQCWIGQRFMDTRAINEGIISDDGKIIEIVQEKKTHKVSIPLLPIAREILDKYKGSFPIFTNQTALNYLKKIGEKAGIRRLHNVTDDRGGEVVTKRVPAYELIGTHTARRSFICNMLKRGFDAHLIMKITGHNDVESFQKYVKLTSTDAATVILDNEANKMEQSGKLAAKDVSMTDGIPTDIDGILNYVFALDKAMELLPLMIRGIDVYGLDNDINEIVSIIKDRRRIPKVINRANELLSNDKIKDAAINKLLVMRPVLEQIGKLKNDIAVYQMFINSISELGLLDIEIPTSTYLKEYYSELPNMIELFDKLEVVDD